MNKQLLAVPVAKRIKQGLCILVMLLVKTVYAQQCFSDANSAYAYLISQEQLTAQETKLASRHRLVYINRATEAELTTLEGIGSNKAKEIILYREAFGPFASINSLTQVKGIGAKTIEKNRSRLSIE